MSETFLIWKTAHILSATVLFGTGFGTAFFCWFGYRHAVVNGEIESLRAVLRLTVIADAVFTAPAVLFQPLSGVVMMHMLGWSLTSVWAQTVIALYILTGACWLPVVWLQVQLSREAQNANSMAALTPRFHRRFLCWFAFGVPAFAAVIALFYLMVAKPFGI